MIEMKKFRKVLWVLLIGYLIFILCYTVICREPFPDYRYIFVPFWSYVASAKKTYLIAENLLNILMFVPVGALLKLLYGKVSWWKILVIMVLFSMTIECLQLVFKKGFCEFDDMFHNAIGGMIGYYLCGLVTKIKLGIRREN